MNISLEIGLLVGSLLIFGSILISKTGYRFGIPTLLMFLVAGMLFGTDGVGIQFDNATQAQYIGTIALSIILFSGGMDTKLSDIRPVAVPGIMLSTVGVLLTTALTGLFIYFISGWQHTEIGFSLLGSLLLAATMSSTDSASVFNILRTQRINLRHNLRPMLELESGSNDPMAYLLTILLIQCIQSGDLSAADIATSLVLQFAVGGAAGFLLGKAAVWLMNRINLKNEELYPVLMISFVFIIYCATFLLKGNGYLAVYLAGLVIGNSRLIHKKETGTFLNGVTWLLQVVMFLVLGLLVNPHELLPVTHIGLGIGILSFIPYVGSTTGFIISVSLAAVQFDDWKRIAVVVVIFFTGQMLEGNVLTPKLVGEKVGLHPVWVMFALLVGATLFGFLGVLIAVPAAAIIGVLVRFGIQKYMESALYLGTAEQNQNA